MTTENTAVETTTTKAPLKFLCINVQIGDLVQINAGRTRASTGRVVRATGANVVVDTYTGYVARKNVIRVLERPAHVNPVMVCPIEFFQQTRPIIRL